MLAEWAWLLTVAVQSVLVFVVACHAQGLAFVANQGFVVALLICVMEVELAGTLLPKMA